MSHGPVADTAIYLWIPFSLLLFFVMRPQRAALWSIFGGVMFLPMLAGFGVPMLPPFTKETLPYWCVLIGCTFRRPGLIWKVPHDKWVLLFTAVMLLGGVGTGLTNKDSLEYGLWTRIHFPGLTVKDGLFPAVNNLFASAVPLFVGAALFRERRDIDDLFAFLTGAGIVYSVCALYEVRMSPQLHNMVYGYMQHDFGQTMREGGGFRPMAFMAHGLALSLFLVVTLLAAIAVKPIRAKVMRLQTKWVIGYLALVVLACKSSGAIFYALVAGPTIAFASPKKQQRLALFIGLLVLIYPALRQADLFPTKTVLAGANVVSAERMRSLEYRFINEDALLKKAKQRLAFGWGLSRNEVYNDDGRAETVTDGHWIIVFGVSGVVGFVTVFGLLVLPIFLTTFRARNIADPDDRRLVTALSVIVAVTALDLLPNGLFSSYPFFLSGALLSLSRAASTWEPAEAT